MIPAAFDYVRATSVDEAVATLAEHGRDARLLAGGHSLLPAMKLRQVSPGVLVDIDRLDELRYVREEGDEVAIGALTRHAAVEYDLIVAEHLPLLGLATSYVGDPQVRHRGTIGGAASHADPAGDHPAVLLALDASMVVAGAGGRRRTIAAADFFTGPFRTAMSHDEVLVEIRVPKTTGAGWSYQRFTRRALDWPTVAVAVVAGARGSGGGESVASVGLANMGATPLRAAEVERALREGVSIDDAAELAEEGSAPVDDLKATADYRRHLVRVLVRRALTEAGVGDGGGEAATSVPYSRPR